MSKTDDIFGLVALSGYVCVGVCVVGGQMINNKDSTYKNDLAARQQSAFKHAGNR